MNDKHNHRNDKGQFASLAGSGAKAEFNGMVDEREIEALTPTESEWGEESERLPYESEILSAELGMHGVEFFDIKRPELTEPLKPCDNPPYAHRVIKKVEKRMPWQDTPRVLAGMDAIPIDLEDELAHDDKAMAPPFDRELMESEDNKRISNLEERFFVKLEQQKIIEAEPLRADVITLEESLTRVMKSEADLKESLREPTVSEHIAAIRQIVRKKFKDSIQQAQTKRKLKKESRIHKRKHKRELKRIRKEAKKLGITTDRPTIRIKSGKNVEPFIPHLVGLDLRGITDDNAYKLGFRGKYSIRNKDTGSVTMCTGSISDIVKSFPPETYEAVPPTHE